jgi:transcriptional regulator with PAS, ATPase and Fis domain
MTLQQIKQRFGVIGDSPLLNRALETAIQVASTDITVMITGESGTGKEAMPQIIHSLSPRKHNKYIAVNCGAIPEGTIDSELFGHEKGAFTGAQSARKGYFEVADGGTVFLDEVSELPKETQVRLLRILETGEYIRVGSSENRKVDVRIVAASNIDMIEAVRDGKFREDLYYRLNTVPIHMPPLRERKEDIHLLFRKFSADVAEKYNMPKLKLTEEAKKMLEEFRWPGNIRQLKNITEQIAVIENERTITPEVLLRYLPHDKSQELPAVRDEKDDKNEHLNEREILYKFLFEMKQDIAELKRMVFELGGKSSEMSHPSEGNYDILQRMEEERPPSSYYSQESHGAAGESKEPLALPSDRGSSEEASEEIAPFDDHEEVEESLSLDEHEKELIQKALERHQGKRKDAARELGISERTLYRKIKAYNIR